MIGGGLPTRVYYVSQGGFDTHAGQVNAHARLMGELNDALSAFATDLKQQGNFDRVLLITFSEFGRRLVENANGGTDHGAAEFAERDQQHTISEFGRRLVENANGGTDHGANSR